MGPFSLKISVDLWFTISYNTNMKTKYTQDFHAHHIIPKHAGGTDDPTNLIVLHPIDHVIWHLVRYKMTGEVNDLGAAKILMGSLGKDGMPISQVGIKRKTPAWNKGLTKETDARVAKNAAAYPEKRKPSPRGPMPQISQALKGRKLSPEHVAKLKGRKLPPTGRKLPIVKCVYCNHENNSLVIARFHNEKCKHK